MRRSSLTGKLFYSGAILLIIIAFSGQAYGQARSGKVLQEMEKKELVPKETAPPVIQEKEEIQPEGTDEKKILIKRIRLVGATLIDEQTIKEIIRAALPPAAPGEKEDNGGIAVNREFSRSELDQIAADIAAEYRKQGRIDGESIKEALAAALSSKEHKRAIAVNRELGLAGMSRIAGTITAEYQKRGYTLAYAFIPRQEIKDGTLEIKVREGRIGEISVAGNKSYGTGFIAKHLEKIKEESVPKEETLERSLLLLNDYQSLNVKALLKAGKEPGTTDIVAEVKDSRPLSGSLSYDNFGSKTTSKDRLSLAFSTGNLAASGDSLMLSGTTGLASLDFNRLSYGRAEYLVPVNYGGTKLGVFYANSLNQVGEEFSVLDISGKANVAGIYLTHPFIKKRSGALDVRVGFDYKDVYDYLLGDTRSTDKIRAVSMGATYDFADRFSGRNIFNIVGYQGLGGFMGGSGTNDAATSRVDSDGAYRKLTAAATRVQKLPGYNYLLLKATGQFSNNNLFVAEQFIIGGAWGVRGYAPSSLSGDSGYLLSAEFHLSPLFPETRILDQKLGDAFKFVLFTDTGGVYRNNIQAGEDRDGYQTALGAGIRLYYSKYFSLRLDWAVPRKEGRFNANNGEIYLQTTAGF